MTLGNLIRGYDKPERPRTPKQTLTRILRFSRRYRWRIAYYIILLAAAAAVGILPPLLLRQILDSAVPQSDMMMLAYLGTATLLAYGTSAILLMLGGYVGTLLGTSVVRDLRQALFDRFQSHPFSFFIHARTGAIQSRLNNDVLNAQQMFTGALFSGSVGSIAGNTITVAFTLGAMFVLSWPVALATLLLGPVFYIASSSAARRMRRLVSEQMSLYSTMNSFTQERFNVGGALLVKTFGTASRESASFTHIISKLQKNNIKVNMITLAIGLTTSVVGFVAIASVYWVGAALVISDSLTIGTVVALAVLVQRGYTPLLDLATARISIQTALVSFERVFDIIDRTPSENGAKSIAPRPLEGKIKLRNVWFTYSSSQYQGMGDLVAETNTSASLDKHDSWALRDVSITIPKGTITALVGPSGSGKTTIGMLIGRLYEPDRGEILFDDFAASDFTISVIRNSIGFATQDSQFFHQSIRDNLLYAKPTATDQEISAVCKSAYIHDLITSLPQGYQTPVGGRGYRFSGGEKQRLAIARVLLRDPRIVILDEATAHLDTNTEILVQRALRAALKGRTSVVIAHRLSTIMNADQVVVLNGGEVLDTASHDELLERSELYRDLCNNSFLTSDAPVDLPTG